MIESGGFDYAQARLQARHGARPSEAAWGAIDAAVALNQFVENVRATTLAPSLDFFRPSLSIHEAEQALRSAWRRGVFKAARWVPPAWRSALQWLAGATELPVLSHLQRGEPLPDWLKADPVWQRALEGAPESAPSLSPGEQLVASFSRLHFEQSVATHAPRRRDVGARPLVPSSIIDAWTDEWRSRWPRIDADTRRALEDLIALLGQHVEQMRCAESAAAGRALRHDLRLRLARSLHLHAQTPVAVIAHLLLLALDLERLREGLVRRILIR
jgi:hypothetical protein